MVGVEAALEIRVLHRHGKSIREIARETGVARNTVRRYLRDEAAARYKPRPPRSTKLDPFKAYVAERLGSAAPEWIPASVLLMELRECGYCGGYTMLKLFVASLRPQQAVEPAIRFETGPGEQMQVDWAALAPCMMRGPGCAAGALGRRRNECLDQLVSKANDLVGAHIAADHALRQARLKRLIDDAPARREIRLAPRHELG
jgi:transcriptional regulator with XRE-family HTH domain